MLDHRRSLRALLASAGALAALTLAAGCSASSGSDDASSSGASSSASSSSGQSASGSASGSATPTESASDASAPPIETTPASTAAQPSAAAAGAGQAGASAPAPAAWGKTVLGVPDPAVNPNTNFYAAMGMFHDDHGMAMDTITADMIKSSELAGGTATPDGTEYAMRDCSGSTTAGTADAVRCTMTSTTGKTLHVYIRATPTAYDHPGLIAHYTTDEAAGRFRLPPGWDAVGSAMGEATSPAKVTAAEAADMASQAILTQHDHEWDGSANPSSQCQIQDQGKHLLCTVTGTPEGGKGDGTWYGTYQPNADARVQYLFTRIPQG